MYDPDLDDVPAVDLAFCEAELPESARLRVRDFWDAVIAAELGARPPRESADEWPVLRLIPGQGAGRVPGVRADEAA